MNCEDIARLAPLHLSGELHAPLATEYREHLSACSRCAEELEQQRHLDTLVRENICSEQMDSTALEQRIREQIGSPAVSRWKRPVAIGAGVAAMFVAGILLYRMALNPHPQRVCLDAARDYRTEVIDREPRRWLSDPDAVADLAQRIRVPASLIPALTPSGYHLEHGKLCRLEGRVFLHLVYAQGAKTFSVYLRQVNDDNASHSGGKATPGRLVYETESGGERVAYFESGSLQAMLVTDQPSEPATDLERFAARVL